MAATGASSEIVGDLQQFLKQYYREEIGELARLYPQDKRSLTVDWMDLYRYDPDLADDYLQYPDDMRAKAEEALRQVPLPVEVELGGAHVRVTNLGETTDLTQVSREDNVNTLIETEGQVAKVSKIKPKIENAAFECQRCGTLTRVRQSGGDYHQPHECQGCERQGPFRLNVDQSEFVDHQMARIQEPPQQTKGGTATKHEVALEDDLVGAINPGDEVRLTGKVTLDQSADTDSGVFPTKIEGRSVTIEESDFGDLDVDEYLDEIKKIANGEYGDPYELVRQSINAKHHGDGDIKLALALQLFGGVEVEHVDGDRERGDIHVLLLGDPGCGKSVFLRKQNQIAPRATYSSGKGASAAGLTASAVRDDFGDTEWSLKAGALALANNGIACVDEIDKMDDDAVSSMHEALEGDQQVHINKAGINTHIPTRASLLAAGNPRYGRFDPKRPLADQIELGPTLLSRFDLIFLVDDQPDYEEDKAIVDTMVESHAIGVKHTRGEDLTEEERRKVAGAIHPELLRAYVAHARQEVQPRIPDGDVREHLREYYATFRRSGEGEDTPVPITPRNVQAVMRLAEASARIRLDDAVTEDDVTRALDLLETSLRQVGYDPETDQFDVDIIETGSSKSQKQRYEAVLDFIESAQEEYEAGVPREEVVAFGDDNDMSEQQVTAAIENWLQKGRIYHTSRSPDRYRTS